MDGRKLGDDRNVYGIDSSDDFKEVLSQALPVVYIKYIFTFDSYFNKWFKKKEKKRQQNMRHKSKQVPSWRDETSSESCIFDLGWKQQFESQSVWPSL